MSDVLAINIKAFSLYLNLFYFYWIIYNVLSILSFISFDFFYASYLKYFSSLCSRYFSYNYKILSFCSFWISNCLFAALTFTLVCKISSKTWFYNFDNYYVLYWSYGYFFNSILMYSATSNFILLLFKVGHSCEWLHFFKQQ